MNLIRLLIFIPIALYVGNLPSEFFIRYVDDEVFVISTNDHFDGFILWCLTCLQWFLTIYIAGILKPTFFKKKYFKIFFGFCCGLYCGIMIAYYSSIEANIFELYSPLGINVVAPLFVTWQLLNNSRFDNKLDNDNPDLW